MHKKVTTCYLHPCSTGTDLSVTKGFSRVGSNVYLVGNGWLLFTSLSWRVSKISSMFDISLTLPNSCSRPWPHPLGNGLVLFTSHLVLSLPGLSVSLPVLSLSLPDLSYHETGLSFCLLQLKYCSFFTPFPA